MSILSCFSVKLEPLRTPIIRNNQRDLLIIRNRGVTQWLKPSTAADSKSRFKCPAEGASWLLEVIEFRYQSRSHSSSTTWRSSRRARSKVTSGGKQINKYSQQFPKPLCLGCFWIHPFIQHFLCPYFMYIFFVILTFLFLSKI